MTIQEKLELLHAAIQVYNQDKQSNKAGTGTAPTRKTIPEIYKELLSTIQED